MLCEYTDLTDRERNKVEKSFHEAGIGYVPSKFMFVISDSTSRNMIVFDKNGKGFIYFPGDSGSPAKRWKKIVQYIGSKHNHTFPADCERRHLDMIRNDKELFNEFYALKPACLNKMHIKAATQHMSTPNNIIGNSQNTAENRMSVSTKKHKTTKYPIYTDKMLNAIRNAIADSDVNERYADAWNGFTVTTENNNECIRIGFAPKDGAPYSICPVTLPKASSYSCSGEVKRIMKIINGNLPLKLTDELIKTGTKTCIDTIKQQIKEGSPWVVPSDLTDFVGDWTLNSYKSIIEDIDEPLNQQQEFATSHALDNGNGNTTIQLEHGTRVIYNPQSDEFVGFDGDAAYTANRITSIMENADGYRRIKRAVTDSEIEPSDCKFRSENWKFNNVDVIVTTSSGEHRISVDTNSIGFADILTARLSAIHAEETTRADRERDAIWQSGMMGKIVTDAVIETIKANSRITSNTIVKLLRGLKVNRSYKNYAKTKYEGRLNLVQDAEIEYTIDRLVKIGFIDEQDVQGDYGWFTVLTIDDNAYDRYRDILRQFMDKKNGKTEIAKAEQWHEYSTSNDSGRNNDKDNDRTDASPSHDTGNGENGENNERESTTNDGAKDEKLGGEKPSLLNDNKTDTPDDDDAAEERFELETKNIEYLLNHPAVLSLSWDGVQEWLRNLDPSTVKYMSVMKKLEQIKPRKSLINKMLDVATGADIKKAAKKAEKATKAKTESTSGKKGKTKQQVPPHRIELRKIGKAMRYVVVSESGKVLDNAQGYGFKSEDAAERCFAFKSSGKGKEVKKAEDWWRQKNHRKILRAFEDEAFYAMKEGRHVRVAELDQILSSYNINMDSIGILPSMLIKGAENLI